MTPKQKAEELKEMFDGYIHYAERAVDEIIGYCSDIYDKEFMEKVKQELEKL